MKGTSRVAASLSPLVGSSPLMKAVELHRLPMSVEVKEDAGATLPAYTDNKKPESFLKCSLRIQKILYIM